MRACNNYISGIKCKEVQQNRCEDSSAHIFATAILLEVNEGKNTLSKSWMDGKNGVGFYCVGCLK